MGLLCHTGGGLAGRQKHEKQVGPVKVVSKEEQATNDTMCIGPNKIRTELTMDLGLRTRRVVS